MAKYTVLMEYEVLYKMVVEADSKEMAQDKVFDDLESGASSDWEIINHDYEMVEVKDGDD